MACINNNLPELASGAKENCQTMSPSPTAATPPPTGAESPRLIKRRNAMANVMDGMTDEEVDLIRTQHDIDTAHPTCLSATASSSTTRERSTSSNSCREMENVNGSGLAALSLDSSSTPDSPSLKHRRNGVPDIFADVDSDTQSKLQANKEES